MSFIIKKSIYYFYLVLGLIENERELTAMGVFCVDKMTFVPISSDVLTYFIILMYLG